MGHDGHETMVFDTYEQVLQSREAILDHDRGITISRSMSARPFIQTGDLQAGASCDGR